MSRRVADWKPWNSDNHQIGCLGCQSSSNFSSVNICDLLLWTISFVANSIQHGSIHVAGCTTPPETSESCNAGPLPQTKYVQAFCQPSASFLGLLPDLLSRDLPRFAQGFISVALPPRLCINIVWASMPLPTMMVRCNFFW